MEKMEKKLLEIKEKMDTGIDLTESETLLYYIGSFKDEVNKRLDGFDENFTTVNKRLDGFDENFTTVNKRLDGFEKRLDGFDENFTTVNKRLDGFEKRLVEKEDSKLIKTLNEMNYNLMHMGGFSRKGNGTTVISVGRSPGQRLSSAQML
jgi:tetrahydromethanopterin S-methyltransferase subunit G